jgi:methanogenesis imperfect marker protein 11
MASISDPYNVPYRRLVAVASEEGDQVELIEFFDCLGGAMWSRYHYRKSPLVLSARCVGPTMRYRLVPGSVSLPLEGSRFPAGISGVRREDDRIAITYEGLGGGGVGASGSRSRAAGVARAEADPCGGGRQAGSTIWLPSRQRVLVGIDDTDTPEQGATWTLAHTIARTVENDDDCYLSHTIVQLYPVRFRTKNCVGVVIEFASTDPVRLANNVQDLLERYTLSDETGMAVFTGFDPSSLRPFAEAVKGGEVPADALGSVAGTPGLSIRLAGRGAIGAVAAIPFYTDFDEALALWDGPS